MRLVGALCGAAFFACALVVFFFQGAFVQAASYTWDGGGADTNWSTCANWSSDICPTSLDTVTFNSTSTKNAVVDAGFAGTVANVVITTGYTGTVSLSRSLVVTTGFTQSTGTFVGTGQTLTLNCNLTLSGGTFTAPASLVVTNGGTCGITGTLDVNTTLTLNALTIDSSQIVAIGSGDTLVVTGALQLTNGVLSGGTLKAQASVVQGAALDGGSTIIDLDSASAQTYTLGGGIAPTIRLDSADDAGDTLLLSAATQIQTFTVTAGFSGTIPVSNPSNYTLTIDTYTQAAGTFPTGAYTLNIGSGAFTVSGGSFNAPTNMVVGSGGGVTFTMDLPTTLTVQNFTVNRGGSIFTLGSGDTLVVTGTLALNTGQLSAGTFEARGNVTVGSLSANTMGLLFSGSSASGLANQTFDLTGATSSFNGSVTINKSEGVVTLGSAFVLDQSGANLTVTSGALQLAGYALTATGGTFSVGGSGTLRLRGNESVTTPSLAAGSTVVFTGDGDGAADSYTLPNWGFSNVAIQSVDAADSYAVSSANTLTTNLVGYWPFNETTASASVVDSSGSSNTGTAQGSGGSNNLPQPTADVPSVLFTNTRSKSFDGTDDYVSTTTSFSNPQAFSLALWFKTGTASGKKLIGFENAQTGTGTSSWDRGVYMGTDGKVKFYWYDGGPQTISSAATYTDNAWHHALVTYDNAAAPKVSLYVDGVLQGTGNTTAVSYSGYWRIGGYKGGGTGTGDGYYTGLLDDVRVYTRALSSVEITSLAAGADVTRLVWNDLSISNGTFTAPSTLYLTGSLSRTGGTFAHNSGTINFAATAAGKTISSGFTGTSSLYAVNFTGVGGGWTFQGAATIAQHLTLSAGTVVAPASTLSVAGDFTRSGGTFTHNAGTVVLNGTNQHIVGSTTFYNLSKSVSSADTLTFPATAVQVVLGIWTAQGASGQALSLRSSSTGVQWGIDPQGTRTVQYLNVQDSNNINATPIATSGMSISNGGNNTRWDFNTDPDLPGSLGPTGNVSGGSTIDDTPQFTFTLTDADLSNQVQYELEIDNNADFSSPEVQYTSGLGAQGSASFSVGQAVGGGTYIAGYEGQRLEAGQYYFRVRARDDGGALSNYVVANSGAAALTINTVPDDPTAPGIDTYVYGGFVNDSTPTFSFIISDPNLSDQIRYRFELASDAAYVDTLIAYTSALTTQGLHQFTVGQAAGGGSYTTGAAGQQLAPGNYYWRVQAEDAGGASSDFVSGDPFGVNTAPSVPTGLGGAAVVSGGVVQGGTPSLSFSLADPDAGQQVAYRIQVDDSAGFGSPVVEYLSSAAAAGTRTFTVGQAAGGGSYAVGAVGQTLAEGSYYWRVQAVDPFDEVSAYAAARGGAVAFQVVLNANPSSPSGLAVVQATGGVVPIQTPTLAFTLTDADAGQQVRYQIQIASDPDFNTLIADYTSALAAQGAAQFIIGQAAGGGSYAVGSAATLLSVGGYSWRVRAIDAAAAQSGWTTAPAFTVSFAGSGLPSDALEQPREPVGGFRILLNAGAYSTGSSLVSVTFAAGDNVRAVALSNSVDFSGAVQQPLVQGTAWNVCGPVAVCTAGMKQVYARFYTAYGHASPVVSALIMYVPTAGLVPAVVRAGTVGSDARGTIFFLAADGTRRPFTSWGAFMSYGFHAGLRVPKLTSAELALPIGAFVPPREGSIMCSDRGADKGTCYVISQSKRRGFVSERVFTALGYSFRRAYSGDVSWLERGPDVATAAAGHTPGAVISVEGAWYYRAADALRSVRTENVLRSWGFVPADVVPAYGADKQLSQGPALDVRPVGYISLEEGNLAR